jgi:hypothetical protein
LSKNDFSKILLAAVDESLSSLGDSPKQAILFHLEASFNIKREHIPENMTEFTKALERIFGPGASYLEKLIVKRLHEKLGLEADDLERQDFLGSVEKAKKRIICEGGSITV